MALTTLALMSGIESAFRTFTGKRLQKIIDTHMEKHPGTKVPGYLYQNQGFYVTTDGKPLIASLQYMPFNTLPESLHPLQQQEHADWLEFYQHHDRDFPRIRQKFGSVLARAKSLQDLRDMIPDHVLRLVNDVEGFSELQRTRPSVDSAGDPAKLEELALTWDRKILAMYADVSDLLDQYLGYRYLA